MTCLASRRRSLATAALAAALLVAPGTALADTPPEPPTSTEPVSTVTLVPSPPPPTTRAPAPDARPVHKAPVHKAPVQRSAVTHSQPAYTPPPQRSAPTTPARPAAKKVVHTKHPAPKRSHPVTKPHPTTTPHPAKQPAPASTTVPTPAAHRAHSSWFEPVAIGLLIALLVGAGLVAGIRELRKTPPATAATAAPEPLIAPPAPLVADAPPFEPALEAATARPGAPPPPPVEVSTVPDSCRIAWWRGYVRSRFYAYVGNGDGATVVAESPLFSWRSSEPPPESAAALASYNELVQRLERLGWEPDGREENWYDVRFRQAATVRRQRPAAEAPAADPAPIA